MCLPGNSSCLCGTLIKANSVWWVVCLHNKPSGLVLLSIHLYRSWIHWDIHVTVDVPGTVMENIWLMPRLWLHSLMILHFCPSTSWRLPTDTSAVIQYEMMHLFDTFGPFQNCHTLCCAEQFPLPRIASSLPKHSMSLWLLSGNFGLVLTFLFVFRVAAGVD